MRAMSCLNFYKEITELIRLYLAVHISSAGVIRILSHRHRLGVKYVVACNHSPPSNNKSMALSMSPPAFSRAHRESAWEKPMACMWASCAD